MEQMMRTRISTLDTNRNCTLDALTDLVVRAQNNCGQPADASVQEIRELWILDGLSRGWLPSALARVETMALRASKLSPVTIAVAISSGCVGIMTMIKAIVMVSPMMCITAGFLLLMALYAGYTSRVLDDREKAMNGIASKLKKEAWPVCLSRALMRPQCPDLPPLLARLGKALALAAADKEEFDPVRLSDISPADHVAMMRLASNLHNVERKPFSRAEVILDGDTREACCRVLEGELSEGGFGEGGFGEGGFGEGGFGEGGDDDYPAAPVVFKV